MGHPTGLFLLFFVEMWERFSYYGMRGLLVLYLISVISPKQLPEGAYTNIVDFGETPATADAVPAVQSQVFSVVVGSGATEEPAAALPSGTTSLVVRPAIQTEDPKNPQNKIWVASNGPIPGSYKVQKAEDGTFSNGEVGFIVSNPTDKPIKAEIKVRRDTPESRTYFTINDNPGTVATEIKPDSQMAEGETPFVAVVRVNDHDSGRNWQRKDASTLYGWYTGLAYLFPILGGIIADKLIGTHRSMLTGGILISIGHIILGISGMGGMALTQNGLTLFIMGLAVIVLGTGYFKPTVSVMVGQLYKQGDPRRDGAFTIFYMGINLGAFICAFVCGTLGEKVGWHYGFAAAAVGMLLGLGLYMIGKPLCLKGIGEPPKAGANGTSIMLVVGSLVVSALFAGAYHAGLVGKLGEAMAYLQSKPTLGWSVVTAMLAAILGWVAWFVAINRPEDRGPVITIFVFMFFNAFFWIAFEQAGSSVNIFTEQNTDRTLGSFEVPATWFQSVNAGLIFIMAPIFASIWTRLGNRKMNPSQPMKIALGLIFLGLGYVFMVFAGKITVGGAAKASMVYVLLMYFWHTVGELCLSPTGLSYVTKAAPVRFVSLLMGIWFISSFIANLGGGLVAGEVEAIEKGELQLPWTGKFGGQGDFFFLFVVTSIGAGLVILILTPLLKKLIQGREDTTPALADEERGKE